MDASTLLLVTPLRSTMALFASAAPCAQPESVFPVDVEDLTIPNSLSSKQQTATLKT
jgi:hypothetical protein